MATTKAKQKAKEEKNPRGCFEKRGVWWINYYINGQQHRECVGTKQAAKDLYGIRKADARMGRKLPELRNPTVVTLSELIDDALEFVADHEDLRNYISKAEIVRKALGIRAAAEIKPQELDRWLRKHCKTAATTNRYKAFVSLCYREGIVNEKVDVNPALLVRHRKESAGRLRFLSREEYARLYAVIERRFPEHLAEFVFSVHSGARLSEQYRIVPSMVDLEHRVVRTRRAKNNRRVIKGRTIDLNPEAVEAIKSMLRPGQKAEDPVFPREGDKARFDTRSWFVPCLKEAGIEGYVWHSNRHTFCSWLAMAGATTREIMDAAGHKTEAMAARYSHLSPAHRTSVVDKISDTAKAAQPHAPKQAPSKKTGTKQKKSTRSAPPKAA
jgi:integrase